MSFNPQLQSKFFASPTEIRHAIYAHIIPDGVHLLLCDNTFRLLPCVQRANDGDPDCDSRKSHDDVPDSNTLDTLYPRRLQSSWGEHWRCEENMLKKRGKDDINIATALLCVCKLMFVDFAGLIADTVTIHINEFESLGTITSEPILDALAKHRSHAAGSTFLGYLLPNLKNLTISLRPPPGLYHTLEGASDDMGPTYAWAKLPVAIKNMSKLRKLRLWLDHSETSTWSMVNERAILSPWESLASDPNLNFSINLPKLHPKWESPERHFIEDKTPLGTVICRRYRQRYYKIEGGIAPFLVQHKPDFPILYFFEELWEISKEEVEEMERHEWEFGDPRVEMRRYFPESQMIP